MSSSDESQLLTFQQVLAGWLPISRSMLYSEIRKGRIRVTKLGRRSFISRRDLENYLAGLEDA